MGIIDDKIREYWQTLDRAGKNQAAYAIRKACHHWAKIHDDKLAEKVEWLEEQAETELQQFQPGWTQFVAKKEAGASANLKNLAPGYHHERRMYVAMGKQGNPVSAAQIRDRAAAATAEHNPHWKEDYHTTDFTELGPQLLPQLTDAEWDGYAGSRDVTNDNSLKVLFFDKLERLKHMVRVMGGLLVWAKDDRLCNLGAPDAPFMYAMDSYGNLFARTPTEVKMYFNHSSFNAGRGVICAGNICAQAGKLYYIDNGSGHYQPTRGNLYSCVQKLINDGVRMDFGYQGRTRVRAHGVGDWPAIHYGNVPGFDQVSAALNGQPPAPLGDSYNPWPR